MTRTNSDDAHARRRPIVRARRVHVAGLAVAEREAVLERLYTVFCAYFTGHDRATFESIALPTPETRLALLYGDDDVLAGFASNTIQRRTIDGRPHAAMSGSGFILPEYRGGTVAGAYMLSEAARFMLRHPRVPFGLLGALLGPTTYQRFARSFARIYPHRRLGFPPDVARVVQAFARARDLSTEGAPPWTVHLGVRPLRTAPMTAARAGDPDVRYFCDANPGYVDGHALLVWIPLDPANIASAAGALTRDGLRGALGWLRGRAVAGLARHSPTRQKHSAAGGAPACPPASPPTKLYMFTSFTGYELMMYDASFPASGAFGPAGPSPRRTSSGRWCRPAPCASSCAHIHASDGPTVELSSRRRSP